MAEKRRGRGSGGVQPVGTAGTVWRLFFDAPPGPDGKRRRRSKTVHGPRVSAERELRRLLAGVDNGEHVETTDETLRQYLDRWLPAHAALKATSPRTMKDYHGLVTRYLEPALGQIELSKLRPEAIQALYAGLGKRGLSPRTVLHVHRLLFQALERAVRWQLIVRNPARSVDAPRARRREMQALSRDDLGRFLEAVDGSPYRDIYVMDLYTGLRRSEILGLHWPQVDLDQAGLLTIHDLLYAKWEEGRDGGT